MTSAAYSDKLSRKEKLIKLYLEELEEFRDPKDNTIKPPRLVAQKTGAPNIGDKSKNTADFTDDAKLQKKAAEKYNMLTYLLKRVRQGEYLGVCMECEEEISFKRLQVYPATECCVHCQDILDKKK